jgi:hypothetical protein
MKMKMRNELLQSVSGDGRHYSINKAIDPMGLLRTVFPSAKANELNFCLFSTSGVHGTYRTIEEEEEEPGVGVTFVIVHPRLVTLQYGVVYPETPEDFAFLKKLRRTSKEVVVNQIG